MGPQYKLVRVFASNTELKVAKSYLESHGIECFVPDEKVSSLYGGASSLFNRGELFVRKEDFPQALKLLNTLKPAS